MEKKIRNKRYTLNSIPETCYVLKRKIEIESAGFKDSLALRYSYDNFCWFGHGQFLKMDPQSAWGGAAGLALPEGRVHRARVREGRACQQRGWWESRSLPARGDAIRLPVYEEQPEVWIF